MYRKSFIIAVICIVLEVSPRVNAATDKNYRLDSTIIPLAYELTLTPYFKTNDDKEFTFDGEVTIEFTSTNDITEIKLHSEDLNFTVANIAITNLNDKVNVNVNAVQFDQKYTFAQIAATLSRNVEYALKITYRGPIRDDLNGFYKTYFNNGGNKIWMGATQMEATHARKVFPCFDEPQLKAEFTINIIRNSDAFSLANTKLNSSQLLDNGLTKYTYNPTPKMSTYLVAFVVSEQSLGSYTNGSKEFGIYTQPNGIKQAPFAFDFGKKVLKALGDYFGIDYYTTKDHLKMDHVALPDFEAGAMENWGLVTYRESYLMYDVYESGPNFKYEVAQVIAHETTHMWFGDLVTCHWWSDTWLNEGFANYFQDYIITMILPELGANNVLVTGSVYPAYDADAVSSSPPISNENINSPDEISAHFGRISYEKASSVIRMIHHWIGDDAFQSGLQHYLKNNTFGPGHPYFLYASLEEGVSENNDSLKAYPNATVTLIMATWIQQAGYPVVKALINHHTGTIVLTQILDNSYEDYGVIPPKRNTIMQALQFTCCRLKNRFYLDKTQSSNETYLIPISYTTGASPNFNDTKPQFIMPYKAWLISLPSNLTEDTWVIFNVQETGFYRVNYDDYSWQVIASALKGSSHKDIHPLNRAKIVNDLFAFVYADLVEFSVLHNVLDFLDKETDFSVWTAALKGLNKLRNSYLAHKDILAELDEYSLGLINTTVDTFGYSERSNETFEDRRNRQQILEFACKLDHSGCVQNTLEKFKSLKLDGVEVSASLRTVVYTTGLRYGDAEDYNFLWARMKNTTVASEAWTISRVLGYTTDTKQIRSYLTSVSENDSPIRMQDQLVPLKSVLSNYSNVQTVLDELTMDYVTWDSIFSNMGDPLGLIASALRTQSEITQFEDFLQSCIAEVCTEEVKASATKSLTSAKTALTWAESHKETILTALKNISNTILPSIFTLVLSLTVLYIN